MADTPGNKRSLPDPEPNPWRCLERRSVYSNPWIQVEEHAVLRPDGSDGIYGVVHPTHLALGIVPVDDTMHTWLVGQHRYPLDLYSWEIPEGGGDPDRDPREEAARELLEETGIRAQQWTPLLRLHTSNCFTSEQALVFLARGLSISAAQPDGCERLQLHRLPLSEAVELVMEGHITDAISVAALPRAARLLGLNIGSSMA